MLSPQKDIPTQNQGRTDPGVFGGERKGLFGDKSDKPNFERMTSPKNSQFYERSLSFKTKSKNKVKDLKCLNHNHDEDSDTD